MAAIFVDIVSASSMQYGIVWTAWDSKAGREGRREKGRGDKRRGVTFNEVGDNKPLKPEAQVP